jgi:Pyruvate/2-oxoacid:ferredoxin oxidoreductase delta subunit
MMRIELDKCIACEICLTYCPANAIKADSERKEIYVSEELCFECGLCRRLNICPVDAFVKQEKVEEFPRVVRALFSDPNTTHKLTLVPGRGTEESKTNDVTGRIKRGKIGICIEFGRPGIGSTFKDISLMTSKLKAHGVTFEQNNPLTALMDSETGSFKDELLSQRVLSAIIEIRLDSVNDLEEVIPIILEVSHKIDTVFSLSCISRFDENGELPILEKLAKLGINCAPNAKVNLGLGRPLFEL